MSIIILQILVILNIISFILGYYISKITHNQGVYNIEKPKSFFSKEEKASKTISIDSTKYVADIRTDGMEKKYETLGETKQSKENISSAIDKLKNMKG